MGAAIWEGLKSKKALSLRCADKREEGIAMLDEEANLQKLGCRSLTESSFVRFVLPGF